MSRQIHILWTDDEIDLLKPYILFLEERDYRITTATNGADALSLVEEHDLAYPDWRRWSGSKPSLPLPRWS